MDDIVDINTLFGPLPAASADLAVDGLLELMQHHQVRAACTLSTLGILLDPALGNSATRAACEEQPELLPVATLNPVTFVGAATAVARYADEGFCLVRFFPAEQNWKIDFAPFHWILDAVQETGVPVMVNIAGLGEITDLTRSLGPREAAVILAGVDRTTLAEAIAALRSFPNLHIETSKLLAPGCLRLAVDSIGPDRMLFGTGAPARPIASALHTVTYAGLDEATVDMILGANARRVLNLA
jgi:predicted TIM-barrel fold metal-dependent hydrolase